ncbi:hypothetical protein [Alloalcanivorax xenomutans]|uniref:Uncharacterized protein n=1 Tax=Alloalcanivorax xenomutans TaxID=1094342 RepID=A0A9Q3ZDC2_9GAMM|nr:hypothetical protein [Alloalcanivorax xenomutans]MCE7509623.1 hypothetical protein [Alloalcanivorax xenomutans]
MVRKQRFISFIPPLIQALHTGRKTQTRRLQGLDGINQDPDHWVPLHAAVTLDTTGQLGVAFQHLETGDRQWLPCPYGGPGSHLWVKEPWSSLLEQHEDGVERHCVAYEGTPRVGIRTPGCLGAVDHIRYLDEDTDLSEHYFGWPLRWRASRYMPRRFSRFTLTLTQVRVEQLHEISEEDARAEGIQVCRDDWSRHGDFDETLSDRDLFEVLWEHINGAHPWDTNPFVWVLSFKVCQANIDALPQQDSTSAAGQRENVESLTRPLPLPATGRAQP